MVSRELPAPGDVVAGKYRLSGFLGRGSMGVVFEAHHEALGRRVALKVLAPEVLHDHQAVVRFMNEARAAAKISSDRVVQVLDVGELENGLPYIVMERLDGVDLGELLVQRGPLAVADAVDLLVEVVEGVSHAHLVGIIHRDLKPSNLFLARKADGASVVKVLDFGISKLTGFGEGQAGSMTATNSVIGSPLYMSPEQLRSSKRIDHRADVWSLGVIAYELLTQRTPFEGDNVVALFAAIQEEECRPLVELRREIPAPLDEVVRRCLRRSPEERFATAYAFGAALVPFGGPKARASIERIELHMASRAGSATVSLLDRSSAPAGSGELSDTAVASTLPDPAQVGSAPSPDSNRAARVPSRAIGLLASAAVLVAGGSLLVKQGTSAPPAAVSAPAFLAAASEAPPVLPAAADRDQGAPSLAAAPPTAAVVAPPVPAPPVSPPTASTRRAGSATVSSATSPRRTPVKPSAAPGVVDMKPF